MIVRMIVGMIVGLIVGSECGETVVARAEIPNYILFKKLFLCTVNHACSENYSDSKR